MDRQFRTIRQSVTQPRPMLPADVILSRSNGEKLLRLFKATVETIGESDYSAVTVDEIASRAGIAKGTIFYRYGSKSQLMGEMLAIGVEAFLVSLRTSVDCASSQDEVIRRSADALFAEVESYSSFAKLLLAELWRPDRPWADAIDQARGSIVNVFSDIVECAGLVGRIEPILFFSVCVTAALDWVTFGSGEQGDRTQAVSALAVMLRSLRTLSGTRA